MTEPVQMQGAPYRSLQRWQTFVPCQIQPGAGALIGRQLAAISSYARHEKERFLLKRWGQRRRHPRAWNAHAEGWWQRYHLGTPPHVADPIWLSHNGHRCCASWAEVARRGARLDAPQGDQGRQCHESGG